MTENRYYHFNFWISPSLSGIAERNRCSSQASRSSYRGIYTSSNIHYYYYYYYYYIIDNGILNYLDCILIGIFHLA